MSLNRRHFISVFTAATTALLIPFHIIAAVIPWPRKAFSATKIEDAYQSLFNSNLISVNSKQIKLTVPKTSKTGHAVAVNITSTLEEIESISLFIKNNPKPLVATFQIPEGTIADISTHIRIYQTSTVIAVAKAAGELHSKSQNIRILSGGCGE